MQQTLNTLTISQLTYVRAQKRILHEISFELNSKELLLVEGINGSGKSSLLRILAELTSACSGCIRWNNQDLSLQPHLHYIGHANGLKLGLTVSENLQLLTHLFPEHELNIQQTLTQLNLVDKTSTLVKNLSAGQKRRLALAKLLVIEKPLWILDEPLTALDKITQDFFMDLLKRHLLHGMAIISSHQALSFNDINVKRLNLC